MTSTWIFKEEGKRGTKVGIDKVLGVYKLTGRDQCSGKMKEPTKLNKNWGGCD